MYEIVVGYFPPKKKNWKLFFKRVMSVLFWASVVFCTAGDIWIARYVHLTF